MIDGFGALACEACGTERAGTSRWLNRFTLRWDMRTFPVRPRRATGQQEIQFAPFIPPRSA
jgi:hypothetical protein